MKENHYHLYTLYYQLSLYNSCHINHSLLMNFLLPHQWKRIILTHCIINYLFTTLL